VGLDLEIVIGRLSLAHRVDILFAAASARRGGLPLTEAICDIIMEPSPLTQDSRPEIFQPKIIRLYEALFKVGAFSSWLHSFAIR
jgi:hypothetical protein